MGVSIPSGIGNLSINAVPRHSESGSDSSEKITAGTVVVSIHSIPASAADERFRIA